jgi:putative flippase GtrA
MSISPTSRSRFRVLLMEFIRFGLVGGVGFIVDVGVFNLLRITVLDPSHVHGGPVYAKLISTALAIAINWLGNRFWTFRDRRRSDVLRESIEFVIVSVAGMGIPLLCLWISHYVMGLTSLWADNISSNVIGLGLGAIFRFVLYRVWVFGESRVRPPSGVDTAGKTTSLP